MFESNDIVYHTKINISLWLYEIMSNPRDFLGETLLLIRDWTTSLIGESILNQQVNSRHDFFVEKKIFFHCRPARNFSFLRRNCSRYSPADMITSKRAFAPLVLLPHFTLCLHLTYRMLDLTIYYLTVHMLLFWWNNSYDRTNDA